jgi:hypothetical protein
MSEKENIANQLSKQEKINELKNKLFDELDNEDDLKECEIVENNSEMDCKHNSEIIGGAKFLTKDDITNNLLQLSETSATILEHLEEIVLSELPDSKKITETSHIITAIANIQKQLYEINFKNVDEIETEKTKELNSAYIKNIIDQIKGKIEN